MIGALTGTFLLYVHFISFIHMFITNTVDRSTRDTAGANNGIVDPTNPVHLAYAGAAVVGATVVTGSVAVTTIAAPGMVLIPAAVAAGLCTYAHIENDRRSKLDDDVKTESAAA